MIADYLEAWIISSHNTLFDWSISIENGDNAKKYFLESMPGEWPDWVDLGFRVCPGRLMVIFGGKLDGRTK